MRDYDLTGLGEELAERWTDDSGDRQSLRDLADFFNRRVLAAAIQDADGQPVRGEIENLYRLLTRAESGARAQAVAKLSRMGVDVESVDDDFVSHQAIHTYLTEYRGVTMPDTGETGGNPVDKRAATIERLRNRLVSVTQRSLEDLRDAGHISLESFDVLVGVTVYCGECETAHDVGGLLEERGCECATVPT